MNYKNNEEEWRRLVDVLPRKQNRRVTTENCVATAKTECSGYIKKIFGCTETYTY
jgi:hypothetical protein